MKTYRPKMRGNLCFVELCASLTVLQDKEQCVLFVCIKWNRTAGNSNCSPFVCFLCFMFTCCSRVLCFSFTCVLLPSWKFKLFSFCLLFCVSCSHVALESCASSSPVCLLHDYTLHTYWGDAVAVKALSGWFGWRQVAAFGHHFLSHFSHQLVLLTGQGNSNKKIKKTLRTQFSLKYDYKYDCNIKNWCDQCERVHLCMTVQMCVCVRVWVRKRSLQGLFSLE